MADKNHKIFIHTKKEDTTTMEYTEKKEFHKNIANERTRLKIEL